MKKTNAVTIKDGSFLSPCSEKDLPEESKVAYIRLVIPKNRKINNTPVYIHFSGSGDTNFKRREKLFAMPLAKKGIASIILQSPFYGLRKPKEQEHSNIRTVYELMLLGLSTLDEGYSLVKWLVSEGNTNIGLTGLSRGGLIASIIASTLPLPVAVVPCITGHSGSPVFTEGIASKSCNWKTLEKELAQEYHKQLCPRKKMHDILSNTNLELFPKPQKTNAAIIVAAKNDSIVPPSSALRLHNTWPGSELRWIRGGHISAYFIHRESFRKALLEAMNTLIYK